MEDVWDKSLLADHFDSSDDEEVAKDRRQHCCGRELSSSLRAPSVNPAGAKLASSVKRFFVDSRCRDRGSHVNANNFRATFPVALKNVRSLALADAKIPIVGGHSYAIIVARNVADKTLVHSKESSGAPAGTLAIVPLTPAFVGATYALYSANSAHSSTGWKMRFPQGIPQLVDIRFQLYGWGWDGVLGQSTTIPYPLVDDPALPAAPIDDRNVYFQLEIEHDIL